jgi:hypothetical protein
MQEEFITCKNCGREIPDTQFCIYCGIRLAERPRQHMSESDYPKGTERIFEPTEIRPSPETEEPPSFESPHEMYRQDSVLPTMTELGLDPEISHMSKELSKFQLWKVKLCGMLLDGEVPEKVFANIYKDYEKNVERLVERRNEIVARYRAQYDEKRRELEDARLNLEELRVRVTIGELSESDRLIRTPEIKGNVESLEVEASRLEDIMSRSERFSTELSSPEIFGHEQTTQKFLNSLDDLISTGKIGEDLGSRIREDIEAVLVQLSKMYQDEDEDEKSLRSELDMLEARYKVGEITLSELESARKEVMEKLKRHWEHSP